MDFFQAWLILGLAALAANLPFILPRGLWGAFIRSVSWRTYLLDMVCVYTAWVGFSIWLEGQTQPVAAKSILSFWVTTAGLFSVLALPGFVWCFLYRLRLNKRST